MGLEKSLAVLFDDLKKIDRKVLVLSINFLMEASTLVRISRFNKARHELEDFEMAPIELPFKHDHMEFEKETEFQLLSRPPLLVF